MHTKIMLLLTLLVCACGQKGPLYLPNDESPVTQSNSQSGAIQAPAVQSTSGNGSTGNGVAPDKDQYEAQLKTANSTSNP